MDSWKNLARIIQPDTGYFCDHFWNFTFWKINWRIVHTVKQTESTKTYNFQFRSPFCSWKVCGLILAWGEITCSHKIHKKIVSSTLTKVFLCIFAFFLKNKLSGIQLDNSLVVDCDLKDTHTNGGKSMLDHVRLVFPFSCLLSWKNVICLLIIIHTVIHQDDFVSWCMLYIYIWR